MRAWCGRDHSRVNRPALLNRYFSVVPISLNTVLTCVPTFCTATMIKTAIKDAIRAYSIAVTPDSSLTKFLIDLNISCSENLGRGPMCFPRGPIRAKWSLPLSVSLIRHSTGDNCRNSVYYEFTHCSIIRDLRK